MTTNSQSRRALVMVIDGCGAGASPDAGDFGDSLTCNTLANTARELGGLHLPTLAKLGLGGITPIAGVDPKTSTQGFFGKLAERSNGKDTQTGHWEMMGVVSTHAFPTYPQGFPPEIINAFIEQTGCKGILCNKPYSGTDVLNDLGEEHARTGYPIVYTSGDSVFQIATNVEVTPLSTLYAWSEIARNILQGPHRVGRVIARPFTGTKGNFKRLSGDRHDYAVPPPEPTLLDKIAGTGRGVLGIGKIEDIFTGKGLTHAKHTGANSEGLDLTLRALAGQLDLPKMRIHDGGNENVQMIFTNLVDTDSLFGHRRDVAGYGKALVEIDSWTEKIMGAMNENDLLIISSDHGNDPTAPGTDHTREFVPLLAYSPLFASKKVDVSGHQLGTRDGFYDIAASVADWLGMKWVGPGKSFVSALSLTV
jgi:phosphopentomutase